MDLITKVNVLDRNTNEVIISEKNYPNFSYVRPEDNIIGPQYNEILENFEYKHFDFNETTPINEYTMLIDSRLRISGTPENYVVQLPSLYNIFDISIIHSQITNSQYLIDNHIILFLQETPGVNLEIIPTFGNYTSISQLLNSLQTAMNNEGTSNYTLSVTNGKVTIVSDLISGYFALDFSKDNYLRDILGFEQRIYSGSNSYTGSNNYNLNPKNVVNLNLPDFSDNGITIHFDDYTCDNFNFLLNSVKRKETLKVCLRNLDGSIYNSNGIDHSFLVSIKYFY